MPCNEFTPQCSIKIPDNTPICCKNHIKNIVWYMDDLLSKHNIKHWIDFGTLLGAVKNGEIMPWDTNANMGVLLNDLPKIEKLQKIVEKDGFSWNTYHPKEETILRICRSNVNNLHLNLFFWMDDDGIMKSTHWTNFNAKFPNYFITLNSKIKLYEKWVLAPFDNEKFVKLRYGDLSGFAGRLETQCNVMPYEEIEKYVLDNGWEPKSIYPMTKCAKNTRECKVPHPSITKSCCMSHLREIIHYMSDLLEENGIMYWMDFGTLLGAMRDGEIIPWDNDIDFGILEKDLNKITGLQGKISNDGFGFNNFAEIDPFGNFRRKDVIRICYSPTNLAHVDLFVWKNVDSVLVSNFRANYKCHFPDYFVQNMPKITMCGKMISAPRDTEKFVEFRFGPEWRIPQGSKFTCNATPLEEIIHFAQLKGWMDNKNYANSLPIRDYYEKIKLVENPEKINVVNKVKRAHIRQKVAQLRRELELDDLEKKQGGF